MKNCYRNGSKFDGERPASCWYSTFWSLEFFIVNRVVPVWQGGDGCHRLLKEAVSGKSLRPKGVKHQSGILKNHTQMEGKNRGRRRRCDRRVCPLSSRQHVSLDVPVPLCVRVHHPPPLHLLALAFDGSGWRLADLHGDVRVERVLLYFNQFVGQGADAVLLHRVLCVLDFVESKRENERSYLCKILSIHIES